MFTLPSGNTPTLSTTRMHQLRCLVPALALCVLTACSSTEPAGSFTTVDNQGNTKTAIVRLTSGEEFNAESLRVGADSARYVHPNTTDHAAVPTDRIAQVTFVNRRKGAFRGLRNVLVVSAASILAGFALRSTCNSETSGLALPDCASFTMVVLPIVAAPVSLPGGMLVGALVGHKEHYNVEPPLDQ